MGDFFGPYMSAAERRRMAAAARAEMKRRGVTLQPVVIEGRRIANTFWGRAWCDHLESFSDYVNRLPRGRTYVRNGSVLHLEIERGSISARVQGSLLYSVLVGIDPLAPRQWKKIKERCTGRIGSMLDLLKGKLSDQVMRVVTDRKDGLFPAPREIRMQCSCPDQARMCKHIAAVLYGAGARLDVRPELLFLLRGVDPDELVGANAEAA
ncbi:MAG TPA: SWIM zinc finger family protein, partial [Spirochaetia bacterium]|nr:SWIM zinc finger family protein [Spirochaetia bacterium]